MTILGVLSKIVYICLPNKNLMKEIVHPASTAALSQDQETRQPLSQTLADFCRLTDPRGGEFLKHNQLHLGEMNALLTSLLADKQIQQYLFSFTWDFNKTDQKAISQQLKEYSPEKVHQSQIDYSSLVHASDNITAQEKVLKDREQDKHRTHGELMQLFEKKVIKELEPYKGTLDIFVSYMSKLCSLVSHKPEFLEKWDATDITTWWLGESEIMQEFKASKQKFKHFGSQFFSFDSVKQLLNHLKKYKDTIVSYKKSLQDLLKLKNEVPLDKEIVEKCEFYQQRYLTHIYSYICPTSARKDISFSQQDRTYISMKETALGSLWADKLFFHSCVVEPIICAYYEKELRKKNPSYHVMHTSILDDLSGVDAFVDKVSEEKKDSDHTLTRVLVDFKLKEERLNRCKAEEQTKRCKMIDSVLWLFPQNDHIDFDQVTTLYPELVNYEVRLEEPIRKGFSMALVRATLETIYELRNWFNFPKHLSGDTDSNRDYLLNYKDRLSSIFDSKEFMDKLEIYNKAANTELWIKTIVSSTNIAKEQVDEYIKKIDSSEVIDNYWKRVAI